MIVMYDLEDNIITMFDGYEDCAEYFNTSIGVIKTHICNSKKGKTKKKRCGDTWCRLVKLEKEKPITVEDLINYIYQELSNLQKTKPSSKKEIIKLNERRAVYHELLELIERVL